MAATWFRFAALACALTAVSPVSAQTSPPARSSSSQCIGPPSTDQDLHAILEVVFRDTPRRLLEQKTITPQFFAAVRDVRFEICRDRTWDVVTFPTKPPLVVIDYDLMTFLVRQSQALLLGQHLAMTHEGVETLDLHAYLMDHILKQNRNPKAPVVSFDDLVVRFMGKPVDVREHMRSEQFAQRLQTSILQTDYFLVFHEFCHIQARHLQRRAEIESLPMSKLPAGMTKSAMRVELEKEADSCALEIINRDEARGKFSPISFISAFMVVSTQGLYEQIVPGDRENVTHPAPQARLKNAYEQGLALIAGSPDEARYKRTLDGMYEHFSRINTAR